MLRDEQKSQKHRFRYLALQGAELPSRKLYDTNHAFLWSTLQLHHPWLCEQKYQNPIGKNKSSANSCVNFTNILEYRNRFVAIFVCRFCTTAQENTMTRQFILKLPDTKGKFQIQIWIILINDRNKCFLCTIYKILIENISIRIRNKTYFIFPY